MNEIKKCSHCQTEVNAKATKCPHCQSDLRSWWRRHPILTIILAIGIGIPVISGIVGDSTSTTSDTVAVAPVDPVKLEADKKELEILKKNFDYKYDEFDKKGWYTHKSQTISNSLSRTYLKVLVNNTGYNYLESQYYGSDWLFHTRVEVKIGDAIYKSDDVSTFDENNSRDNTGGSVWETISYTKDRDNGIIVAIALAGDTPIKVRFAGDEGVKDITLSKKDQQAIQDSYRLSQLLKEIGTN